MHVEEDWGVFWSHDGELSYIENILKVNEKIVQNLFFKTVKVMLQARKESDNWPVKWQTSSALWMADRETDLDITFGLNNIKDAFKRLLSNGWDTPSEIFDSQFLLTTLKVC